MPTVKNTEKPTCTSKATNIDDVIFTINDRVVYPSHGVGEIIGEESQVIGDREIEVYVISFPKDKMILRVPKKRATASGLRQISSAEIIKKVITTLQSRPKVPKGMMWSRRAQEYETKINSGDIILLAEVVRDLYRNIEDPDRSYSERIVHDSALNRLVGEFSAIYNIATKDAMEKITDIMKDKQISAAA